MKRSRQDKSLKVIVNFQPKATLSAAQLVAWRRFYDFLLLAPSTKTEANPSHSDTPSKSERNDDEAV